MACNTSVGAPAARACLVLLARHTPTRMPWPALDLPSTAARPWALWRRHQASCNTLPCPACPGCCSLGGTTCVWTAPRPRPPRGRCCLTTPAPCLWETCRWTPRCAASCVCVCVCGCAQRPAPCVPDWAGGGVGVGLGGWGGARAAGCPCFCSCAPLAGQRHPARPACPGCTVVVMLHWDAPVAHDLHAAGHAASLPAPGPPPAGLARVHRVAAPGRLWRRPLATYQYPTPNPLLACHNFAG